MNYDLFSIEPERDILYKDFLGSDTYPVPVLELYSSFDEYEQITLPWLFEETFEEVSRENFNDILHIKILALFLSLIDQTKY